MANVQILVTKMLDECCFPGFSDSHHGNNRIIWTIRHQLWIYSCRCIPQPVTERVKEGVAIALNPMSVTNHKRLAKQSKLPTIGYALIVVLNIDLSG